MFYFQQRWPCLFTDPKSPHQFCTGYPTEQPYQDWLQSALRFQRRRCLKKFTDGRRTPSDGNNSHGLWPGELKRFIAPHPALKSGFSFYTAEWIFHDTCSESYLYNKDVHLLFHILINCTF